MKTSVIFSAFLFLISFNLSAQDLIDVKYIKLSTEEDFVNFESEVLKYIDWLETHSLDDPQRANVNAALLIWISDTPTLTISLNNYIMGYTKKNAGFLMLFMGGWAKFAINNPAEKSDKLKANLAGVNAILDFYKKGRSFDVKKDKKVDKLLKTRAAGKLESFIQKHL